MKIPRATAAALVAGLVLALGACSSGEVAGTETTAFVADDTSPDGDTTTEVSDGLEESDDSNSDSGSGSDDQTADLAASCEEFNTLSADIRAVEPGDTSGYDDIYLRSQEAKTAAPVQELTDVFAVMSLLALEAGSGEDTTGTMETLGQAVFAAAGPCTGEGVTLTIS